MKECTVCFCNSKTVSSEHTHCPANHNICKTCYLRLLKICFCNSKQGNIVYSCPTCRHEHHYTDKEMYKVLNELGENGILYTSPHPTCQSQFMIPNFIRKCEFQKCGCRHQSKDLEISPNVLETFNELIQNHLTTI